MLVRAGSPKAQEVAAAGLSELARGGVAELLRQQERKVRQEELKVRQEERKVCFLLTDGIGDADQCREQALTGENLGITTIGIGIRADVSYIYKNAVTIEKLEDMGTVAFDKLKLAA